MPTSGFVFDPVQFILIPIGESPSIGTNEETSGLISDDFRPSVAPAGNNVVGNTIFRQGGNVHRMRVEGRLDRDSQGDGEAWAYVTLRALGATGLVTLAVNGNAYTKCYFSSGTVSIKKTVNKSFISYTLEFVRGMPFVSSEIPILGAPPEIGTFPDRNSNGDYGLVDISNIFAGVEVVNNWDYAEIREVQVRRPVLTKPIPRSYGAIIEPLKSGREISINLFVALRPDVGTAIPTDSSDPNNLVYNDQDVSIQRGRMESSIQTLEWRIRDRVWLLAGNGNNFFSMHVRRISPRHSDQRFTSYLNLELVQELPFIT